jgi:succinate dehydrogenase / fumarate reductase cytochrome b subunit
MTHLPMPPPMPDSTITPRPPQYDRHERRREGVPRPRFLDLHLLSFPAGALVSIGHRLTGLVLALATPFVAYAFTRSLAGVEGFAEIAGWTRGLPMRLALAALVGALAFHLFAGLRHLLLDAGVGASLRAGRASAWTVIIAGAATFVLAAAYLLR